MSVEWQSIDWSEVRAFYEGGHPMRDCKARFGFSNYAWDKAVTEGLIVPRDHAPVGCTPEAASRRSRSCSWQGERAIATIFADAC